MKNKSRQPISGALTIQEVLTIGKGVYLSCDDMHQLIFFKNNGLYKEDGELLQLSTYIMSIEWQPIDNVDLLMLFKHRITSEANNIKNHMCAIGNQSAPSLSIMSSLESIDRTLSMFNSEVVVTYEE